MSSPCNGKVDVELLLSIRDNVLHYELPGGEPSNGDLAAARKQVVRWTSLDGDLVIRIDNTGAMPVGKDKSPFKESMYCGSRADGNGTASIQAQVKDVKGLLDQYKYTAVLIRDDGTCVSQDPRIIIRDALDN